MNRLISSVLSRTVTYGRKSTGVGPWSLRGLSSGPRRDDNETRITVTDDGQTIVCLHPQSRKTFPYEHSLPYVEEEDRSVLKFENVVKGENIYVREKPASRATMEEIQAITYTQKDVWRRRRLDGIQMRPEHPRKGV